MIFTLLTEIVALHMGPTIVDVRGLSLKFVSKSTLWDMKKCLDDSVQVLLVVAISARILGNEKKGAWGGPARALVGVSEGPGLFDPRESSWSLLSDLLDKEGPVRASETWFICAGWPRPLTEVILIRTGWLTR